MCVVEGLDETAASASANGATRYSSVDGSVHQSTTPANDNTSDIHQSTPGTDKTSVFTAPVSDVRSDALKSTCSLPHGDQWLALRVRGGTRIWPKFTSCFNNHA